MSKFVTDRGWTFAGSCACAAQESKWINPNFPDFRIKTRGNNSMTFEKLVNPLNRTDFRPIVHSGAANFNVEYDKLFKNNTQPDAPEEISK